VIVPNASAVIFLLLAGPAPHLQIQPDQLQRSLSQGRFAEIAKELQQIVLQTGPVLKKPTPAQAKVLRGAIERTRSFLNEKHPVPERNAAHQVLCLSRAFFPEDLPGLLQNAQRVGAGTQRPELIGEPVHRYPSEARKARTQGVVVVEVVIDQEGCARHPKILKGLPLGADDATLAAVQSWTFQPATRDGKIVAVYYTLSVMFNPSDPG
jgi:TonB family protein